MMMAMASRFAAGDTVQTPFGKGVVRETRNSRLLIEVNGRSLVLDEGAVTPVEIRRKPSVNKKGMAAPDATSDTAAAPRRAVSHAVDLHGLTVEEALARVEDALNEALLADVPELHLIHGKSGGRLRAAIHGRLRDVPAVRRFRLDPRNAGVTIVHL